MIYLATTKVVEQLGHKGIEDFLAKFNNEEPWDDVEFVSETWVYSDSEIEKPMYTVRVDAERILLVFPLVNQDSGLKYVRLAFQDEFPWLDGLHEYGS